MQLAHDQTLFIRTYGNLYRVTAIFTTDAAANAYLGSHGNEGVLAAWGRYVLIAAKTDLGTPFVLPVPQDAHNSFLPRARGGAAAGRTTRFEREIFASSLPHHAPGANMSWNTERVCVLVNLWAAGRSASEIATTLGGVTRNAVIGKVHRLALAKRISHARPARGPRAFKAHARSFTSRKPAAPTVIPELSLPPAVHPTIRELTGHHCRWPEGDPKKPGFHFCGRAPRPGKPYCPHHHGHAHQLSTRRGRRPASLHTGEGAQAAH